LRAPVSILRILSLVSTTGQTIPQAQVHNIYINCTAACWGNPAVFETNLFSSDFIHIVDQYVGSEANGRYSLGVSLQITYPVKSQSSFPNLLNDTDIDAILHAAALKLGSGYNHVFNVFVPKGVDYCGGYSPPYTSCFSPDNNSTWTFCALHGYSAFADIPNAVYGTLEPYQDVFSTPYNGVPTPFYACDVGQRFPYSSDTTPTPNGVLVDSAANFVSHELFETITDPDGSEWQAQDGYFLYTSGVEIGDVCEFNSPRHFLVFTPFYISGHLYEIQPEYSNKYHACVTVQ